MNIIRRIIKRMYSPVLFFRKKSIINYAAGIFREMICPAACVLKKCFSAIGSQLMLPFV